MSMEIVIPTFNRSAKLERTLRCYYLFGNGFSPRITVLDGSDELHGTKNKTTCQAYAGVHHIARPGTGLVERITHYLEQVNSENIICLATDEDVFVPDYLSEAEKFMTTHADYSMYVGRYVTFARPVGPLRRIVQHRNVVTDLNINQNNICRRIAMLSYAVTVGCPPVYWGVRRAKQLLASLKHRASLHFLTSHEIVDQILLAYMGKIQFVNRPMLLRDESKIEYIYTPDREHTFNYFAPEERDVVAKILLETGGQELVQAGMAYLDKYLLDFVPEGKPSISLQHYKKTYSKFEPLDLTAGSCVGKKILSFLKAATVFTEIVSTPSELRFLKRRYEPTAIRAFLQNTKSNQLA